MLFKKQSFCSAFFIYKNMKKLEIKWKVLAVNETEGKYFYKIIADNLEDKYYIFCYVGYPSYMKNPKYNGDKYKDVYVYFKYKIGNKKYTTLSEYSITIPFYSNVTNNIIEKVGDNISIKILAEERKDKIKKILGK